MLIYSSYIMLPCSSSFRVFVIKFMLLTHRNWNWTYNVTMILSLNYLMITDSCLIKFVVILLHCVCVLILNVNHLKQIFKFCRSAGCCLIDFNTTLPLYYIDSEFSHIDWFTIYFFICLYCKLCRIVLTSETSFTSFSVNVVYHHIRGISG